MSQTVRERPKWVDFHCHLDLYPNHEALIRECDREGVATLAVTTTPKAWARNQELASTSKHVRVALGLHPQLVAEREGEVALFERLLDTNASVKRRDRFTKRPEASLQSNLSLSGKRPQWCDERDTLASSQAPKDAKLCDSGFPRAGRERNHEIVSLIRCSVGSIDL